MKKLLLFILPLFIFASDKVCTKCNLNKAQMKCNYYVAKKGDTSKVNECKFYADYLNSTKVYGKAAWYYLLSKEPTKALEAAKKAVEMGENYAYEYMAEAQLLLKKPKEAKKSFTNFKKSVGDNTFFTSKHFAILKKIYKNFNENELQ
ncbi:hypothetical protein [Nitrosophilus kaiyonis]|uniref:hypothetical protein n=1 Tax=Nitrosophilus kaiyonis TaxID=2930200 RepID=UPI00249362B0|nr:hypothetical protein [Nitrosophilus kaiyonis]